MTIISEFDPSGGSPVGFSFCFHLPRNASDLQTRGEPSLKVQVQYCLLTSDRTNTCVQTQNTLSGATFCLFSTCFFFFFFMSVCSPWSKHTTPSSRGTYWTVRSRIRKSLKSNHGNDQNKHVSHTDSNCSNKVTPAFDVKTRGVVMVQITDWNKRGREM